LHPFSHGHGIGYTLVKLGKLIAHSCTTAPARLHRRTCNFLANFRVKKNGKDATATATTNTRAEDKQKYRTYNSLEGKLHVLTQFVSTYTPQRKRGTKHPPYISD